MNTIDKQPLAVAKFKQITVDGYPCKIYLVLREVEKQYLISIIRRTLVDGNHKDCGECIKVFKNKYLFEQAMGFRLETLNSIVAITNKYIYEKAH